MASFLSDLGHREQALDAAQEACALLTPYFVRIPRAYKAWMMTIASTYVRSCEALSVEPDMSLLLPIIAVLKDEDE